MLENAKTCQKIPENVRKSLKTLEIAIKCLKMLENPRPC